MRGQEESSQKIALKMFRNFDEAEVNDVNVLVNLWIQEQH